MRYLTKWPYLIVFSFVVITFVIVLVKYDITGLDYRFPVNQIPVINYLTFKSKEDANIIEISLDEVIKKPFVLNQDDPKLINKIRKEYIFSPSDEPYNFTVTKKDENPSVWQAQFVSKLLLHKRNGFFIEAGANDGEFLSNTLVLERLDGWEGLLIESDPDNYQKLLSKHRKAISVPACLSNTEHPKELEFQKLGPRTRLTSMVIETKDKVVVQCFPLYSILLAVGRTKIDYFSLDVEGSELDVLQTIPWDKVEITVFSVEYDNMMNKKEELRKFMMDKGYSSVDHPPNTVLAVDYIFYREDLLPKQVKNGSGQKTFSA